MRLILRRIGMKPLEDGAEGLALGVFRLFQFRQETRWLAWTESRVAGCNLLSSKLTNDETTWCCFGIQGTAANGKVKTGTNKGVSGIRRQLTPNN